MQTVTLSHIWLDDRGVAWVDDTNTKVIEIALDRIAYGWDADEIHEQYPDLGLSQIHAALTYYYDHKAAFDAQIEEDDREVERLRAEAGETPLLRRLRKMGLVG